jgi:type I restriction enzyme S subunit
MTLPVKFGQILKEVFRPVEIVDGIEYACAGVRLHGRGVFVREYKMGERILKKHVQHVVQAGDVVFSTLFAKAGAFAIADADVNGAILSEKFPTYELVDPSIEPDYLRWLFRSGQLQAMAARLVTGVAVFSLSHLSKKKFLDLPLPLPRRERQRAVLSACSGVALSATQALGPLERNKRVAEHLTAAFVQRLTAGLPQKRLGDIGAYALRAAVIQPEQEYRQITVAMKHRGLRLRRHCLGRDIGSPGQCYVEEGDVLFSRIDLRNGAIGIVPKSLAGAVVTRDFPVFVLDNPTQTRLAFLLFMFRSPSFGAQAITASRGTTGRKKLKRNRFLDFVVPWPEDATMHHIVHQLTTVDEKATEVTQLLTVQRNALRQLTIGAASRLYRQDVAAAVEQV